MLPVGVSDRLQLGVPLYQHLLLRLQARLHVQVLLGQAAVGRQRHLSLQLNVLDLEEGERSVVMTQLQIQLVDDTEELLFYCILKRGLVLTPIITNLK